MRTLESRSTTFVSAISGIQGVPPCRAIQWHANPKRHPHALIVPVLNEGQRFRNQLDAMSAAHLPVDIIIVDGGSSDGSTDVDYLGQNGVHALIQCERGLSRQMRAGIHWALGQGYDGVVFIDGNGKDSWTSIPHFCEALDKGIDHAQGSRYIPGGRAINTPWDRTLAVRYLHAPLIRLASGFPYTDTTNGFRAYSRRLLEHPDVQPLRDVFETYNLHYYLAIRAARLRLSVCELPVERAYPATGKTPSKIAGMRGKLSVLAQLCLAVIGAYNPR